MKAQTSTFLIPARAQGGVDFAARFWYTISTKYERGIDQRSAAEPRGKNNGSESA